MASLWKKGRGKLGFLQPLLGSWLAQADTPMGPVRCTRVFTAFGDSYVRLEAAWEFSAAAAKLKEACADDSLKGGKVYREIALIGAGDGGAVNFWSFTSDGKRSNGSVADVSDIHAEGIGFEAQMPGGLARMAYWPDGDGGFSFAVESKNRKGWKRFLEHHYRPA